MGSITILLGRSRWRRRRALPESALSGVDAWGRPDFLYLAASTAKRRVVERDFLAFRRDRPCFAPTVRVFDELADDLWARHGDGRAILPNRAMEYLAEDLLQDGGAAGSWLRRSGPPRTVARALVQLREALDSAGRLRHPPDGLPHAAELLEALRLLERRLVALPGHVPRTVALRALIDRVQEGSPALARQLRAHRTVILDDLLQPPPLLRALLIALCRAWEAVGSHVVIGLETGRDLGGREVGVFFEYDDVDDVAYALRPFRATRGLRRTLFEELVASGEAELQLAMRDRVVPIEPGIPLADPAPADLSDHLYGPRPVPRPEAGVQALLGASVQLHRYETADQELDGVAAQVKAKLLSGTPADDCLVAVAGLNQRSQAVQAHFEAFGVGVRSSRGAPLASLPLAILTRRVATAALGNYPLQDCLALLQSDLVETPDVDLSRLARAARAAGIRDGLPSTWLGTLRSWSARQVGRGHTLGESLEADLAALDATLAPLTALARPMAPEAWKEALLRQLTRLKIPERAAEGPAAEASLDAWGALLEVLDQLVRDQRVAGARDLPSEIMAERLVRALEQTRLRPRPHRGGEIELVDLDEVLGLTPRHLWVVGLTASAWPGPPPPTFLVPRDVLHALEVPRPAENARYLFTSLLRNALDDREIHTLALSWHGSDGSRAQAPSPLLEDLLSLPIEHADPAAPPPLLGDLVDLTPPMLPPSSPVQALGLAASAPAWRALLSSDRHAPMATQARAHRARSGAPGPWDGVLEKPLENSPKRLAVTRLETFLKCPARFWYAETLGLSRADKTEPDLPAHRKGSTLHAILEAFVSARLGTPFEGDAESLGAQLHRIATKALDELAAKGGFEQTLMDHLRDEWLSGLVDERPHGILRAWLEEELRDGGRRVPVSVETRHELQVGDLTLTAGVDRVDRTRGGTLVLDYKSGRAPLASMVRAGLSLQPVAYAAIQAQADPDRPVAAAYVSLKEADQVRPTSFVGDPAVLDELRARRRGRVDLPPEERGRLLEHARESADRLGKGVVHPTLATPGQAGCRHCPYARICRLDLSRAAELSASDADLQRPLPKEAEGEGGAG